MSTNRWIRPNLNINPLGALDRLYPDPRNRDLYTQMNQPRSAGPNPTVSNMLESEYMPRDISMRPGGGLQSMGQVQAPAPVQSPVAAPEPEPVSDIDKLFSELDYQRAPKGDPFLNWLIDFSKGTAQAAPGEAPGVTLGRGGTAAAQGKVTRDAAQRAGTIDAIKLQIQKRQLQAQEKTAQAALEKAKRPVAGSLTPRPGGLEEYKKYNVDPTTQSLSFDRYGQPKISNAPNPTAPIKAVSFTSDKGDQIDAVPGTPQYDEMLANADYWIGQKPKAEKGFATFHNPIMKDDGTYEQKSVPKTGNEGKRLAKAGWINQAAPSRHYGSETFLSPEGRVVNFTQGTPDWEAARKKGSGFQQIAGLPKGGKINMITDPEDPRLKGQNPGTVAWETLDASGAVTGFNMKAGPKPDRVFKPVARADFGEIPSLAHLSEEQLNNLTVSRAEDGEIKTKAVAPENIKRGLTYYNPNTDSFHSVREGTDQEDNLMDAGAFKINYRMQGDAPTKSKKAQINASINNDVHGMRLVDDGLKLIKDHEYIFGTAGGIKRGIQSMLATAEDVGDMATQTTVNSLIRSASDHLRSQHITGNVEADVADWFNPDLPKAKAIENALAYVWAVSQKAQGSGRLALYDLENARDTLGFDDVVISEREVASKLNWLRGELHERVTGKMKTREGLTLQESGIKPKGLVAKKNADGTFSFEEQ